MDITGTNPGEFNFDASACLGLTLSYGDTCSIDVTFAPTETWLLTATLVISVSVDVEAQTVPLTGTEPGAPTATSSTRANTAILNDVELRIGQGYDVHPLQSGRRLILGGVEIAHERGLHGHSDADVLLHAIMDAVLGAAGMDDIGSQFSPTDERWRDVSSTDLLGRVATLIRAAGWQPVNVDATVIAERPRIAPHVEEMRAHIAAGLGLAVDAVGVKATTNEKLGALGREEGIAALAVALLKRE